MNSLKNSFASFIAVIIFSCVYYSCSSSSSDIKNETTVPLHILQEANLFIVSKTGAEFFHNYIAVDNVKTKHSPPYYEIVYNLYIPEKPYVNTSITFTVDEAGKVVKSRDIIGIPNCNKNPSLCEWQVDKDGAIAIAKAEGLEKGIKDWKIAFIWNPERQIYVWRIITVIREFQGDFGYRGSGKEMLIDPVNGEVLSLTVWQIN
ncbi:MAG: hypothetical protein JSW63_08570 [Ignavibacterium sp.]|nr:MAG: hypothetical protein JSW63_08570 [Ignavibacterium sp.]